MKKQMHIFNKKTALLYLLFLLLSTHYNALSMEQLIAKPLETKTTYGFFLPIDIIKKILCTTLIGPNSLSKKNVLSLVCTSWEKICTHDDNIKKYIEIVKTFNNVLINNIFTTGYNLFGKASETELIDLTKAEHFDVSFCTISYSSPHSLLYYAIKEKYYSLFETLLKCPYVIIRPIILKKIIDAKAIEFIDILKKHSFPFHHYHFTRTKSSFPFSSGEAHFLNCTVTYTYAQKKYNPKASERLIRSTIKKNILYSNEHLKAQEAHFKNILHVNKK